MHRRKGTQISETDHGGDNLPSSPTTRRRTSHPSSPRHHPSKVGFAMMLIFLFSALLAVEFIAYRMLGGTTPPPSTSIRSTADTTASSDSAARIVTNAAVHETNNNINSPPKQNYALTPTKHPTTFQPTKTREGWQAKAARRDSNTPNQFWKKHSPDPLPPLPPDVDPTTGEKLPPVIAYVITLTKCGPKHRGGLDGAAVLLHSIRRNSYGWVPIEKQMEQSKSENTQNKGDDENDGTARPLYGGEGGRYRFRAYVIVDPNASPQNNGKSGECARFLQKIGYTVLHRPPLVPLFELPDDHDKNRNPNQSYYNELKSLGYVGMHRPPSSLRAGENPDKLRKFMHNDGCCGYTEMLKLHVYGMVEHELAVHLDFDSLLLRPMDDLFDAMLGKGENENNKLPLAKLPRTKEVDRTKPIDAAFTRDYNSVNSPRPDAPVGYQGGFLAVRPDMHVLERYREVLRTGNFLLGPRDGWGGKVGGFYGDVTFQGILPYYYEQVAPKEEVAHNEAELDRCIFNQMADNPRKSTYKFPRATPLDAKKMGFRDTNICRDGRKDCSDTDCQRIHPKDSFTTHFTFCKKPWDCSDGNPGTVASPTCLSLLKEWYGIRRELEDWWLLPPPNNDLSAASMNDDGLSNQHSFYWLENTIDRVKQSRRGSLDNAQYFGYCNKIETEGYHRLVEPDGQRPSSTK